MQILFIGNYVISNRKDGSSLACHIKRIIGTFYSSLNNLEHKIVIKKRNTTYENNVCYKSWKLAIDRNKEQ